jgi:hypothetical protein
MKDNKHIKSFNDHQENLNISDVSGSEILKYLDDKYHVKDNLMIVGRFDKNKKYNYIQLSNEISKVFGLSTQQSLDLVEKWKDIRFEKIMKNRF